MPRGYQNGAEIDARTHPKSMQKLVPKNIRNISKIYVFRCVKPCKFIVRVIVFEGFARWVHERKIHQKYIKNETTIPPKINEKSMQISCSKK
jgi:hypothetical protein